MMKQAVKTLRARAYVRVSHVGKSRESSLISDEMQIDEARKYADWHGFDFDETSSRLFADLDVSGFRKPWKQRPGLIQHFEAAKRGEFDVLIFYKISRLARNVKEALDLISEFEKLGIHFHFVKDQIETSSAMGRFMRTLLLATAEMQSEDTSMFLKSTWERRSKEGKLHGSTPVWIRRDGESYTLVEEQVEAIRRLVELRLQGVGYVKIAAALNEEGFRTVNGKYWTHGMTFKYLQPTWIETMLGTGFYRRDSEDPVRIENAFPPIITESEADRIKAIQALYSQEYDKRKLHGLDWMISKRRKNGRYSASTVHLLSSILFCPRCGARFVANTRSDSENRSTPHKYSCPNYVTRKDLHVPGLNSVNALALEDAVLRVVRSALVMPPTYPETPKRTTRKVDDLEAHQIKIDRLLNLHLDGHIDEAHFKQKYAEMLAEKELLLATSSSKHVHEHFEQAVTLNSKDELTREELRQLVLLMVERVEAPFTIEGVTIRQDRQSLRRLARILLRFPTASGQTEFIAPIYTPEYTGHRKLLGVTDGVEPDYSTLIGERPRDRE